MYPGPTGNIHLAFPLGQFLGWGLGTNFSSSLTPALSQRERGVPSHDN